MLRRVLAAVVVVGTFAIIANAEEFKAIIKKIDAEKSTITMKVDGEEKTLDVSKDAEIYTQLKGKKNKPGPKEPVTGGLSGLKADTEITVTTIKSGDKEIVAAIKIDAGKKKKKNKTDK